MRLYRCMKKNYLLLSFILLSVLSLGALPLEAGICYSRSFSFLDYEGSPSLYTEDAISLSLSYKTEDWTAGFEGSLYFLEEIKNLNLFLSLGNLGGFSAHAVLCCLGEDNRASVGVGLSFYSIDLDDKAFFAMVGVKAEVLMKVVQKKKFSLLTGLSVTAEAAGGRKGLRVGLVTSIYYGGGLGGVK